MGVVYISCGCFVLFVEDFFLEVVIIACILVLFFGVGVELAVVVNCPCVDWSVLEYDYL